MGVTLVSISRITATGSVVVFSGRFCRVYNTNKERVGEIKESGGLYQVYKSSSEEEANTTNTNEVLTIDELHCRLGHVSHERAKLIIAKGLADGLSLDKESKPTVCESCEWAKATRKAIVKVREGERSAGVTVELVMKSILTSGDQRLSKL